MTRWYSVKRPASNPEKERWLTFGVRPGDMALIGSTAESAVWCRLIGYGPDNTWEIQTIDPAASFGEFWLCARGAVLELLRPRLAFDLGHILALGSWLDMDPGARAAITRAAGAIVDAVGFPGAIDVFGPWVELALTPFEAGPEP